MAFISNGTTILDAGAFNVNLGSMVLLSEQTASASANISFTSGIDSTYPIYKFEYINIHPSTVAQLQFNLSTDGGSNYNVTKTTTAFNPFHQEDDSGAGLDYRTAWDLAQSTSDQIIAQEVGNGNDESGSGYLHLFDPSSTTFVKHFIGVTNYYQNFGNTGSFGVHYAGYGNTTSSIDAVRFQMSSGTIDSGKIKLYGIKDS